MPSLSSLRNIRMQLPRSGVACSRVGIRYHDALGSQPMLHLYLAVRVTDVILWTAAVDARIGVECH